jgi:hypothetical protein
MQPDSIAFRKLLAQLYRRSRKAVISRDHLAEEANLSRFQVCHQLNISKGTAKRVGMRISASACMAD